MITKVFRRVLKRTPLFRFSSSKEVHQHHEQFDHATHHHHHHHIQLDKNASWIKYAENKKLVSLYGFEDQIDVFHDNPPRDQYVHMNGVSKLSLQYYLNDQINFHDQEHDPYSNQPHGYLVGDDPMDNRYSLGSTTLLTMMLITLVLGFSYYVGGFKDYAKSQFEYLVDSKEKVAIMEDNIAKLLNKRRQLDEENILLKQQLNQ